MKARACQAKQKQNQKEKRKPQGKKIKNLLTNQKKNGIIKKSARHCKRHFADEYTEKYSRGRRGAPAKGVDRATGARVQIPPSPFKKIQI